MSMPVGLYSADPGGALAGAGISLEVHAGVLRLPGRRVLGEWDPWTRCIRVFGAAERSDAALVNTLLHEYAHARQGAVGDERSATGLAAVWQTAMTAEEAAGCAAALRRWSRGTERQVNSA